MVLNGCLWLRATRLGSCSPVRHCQILLDVFRGYAGRQGGRQTGSESALSAGWGRGTRAFQTCTGSAKVSNILALFIITTIIFILFYFYLESLDAFQQVLNSGHVQKSNVKDGLKSLSKSDVFLA